MKYYDVIIPLGDACFVSLALSRCKLRDTYFPFDASRGVLWNKCGHGGLSGKVDLICNGFQNFLNLDDLEERGADPGDTRMLWVVDKATGLSYRHDFKVGTKLEEAYPVVKDRYDRAIKRFYEAIEHSDRILFVYMAQMEGFSDEYLLGQANRLQEHFPEQHIDVLYVIHKASYGPTDYTEKKLARGVQRIDANMKYTPKTDMVSIWNGNCNLYDQFLRRYYSPVSTFQRIKELQAQVKDLHAQLENLSVQQNKHQCSPCEQLSAIIPQQLFLYHISSHRLYYRFKLAHLKLKKFLHRGEKRKTYSIKCSKLSKLIADATKLTPHN